MKDLLPEGVSNIHVVVQNNCNQSYTFDIDGPRANFVGTGDFHEAEYDYMKVRVDLNMHTHPLSPQTPGHCFYWMVSWTSNMNPGNAFEGLTNLFPHI